MTQLNLTGTRKKLLFVGNPTALSAKYPGNGVGELLEVIKNQATLLEVNSSDPTDIAKNIRARVGRAAGVVLLGGYDVIPSRREFCVPPGSTAMSNDDPEDGFIVWSDDIYGDVNQDGLPELPVSRVPDAGSLTFLAQCLNAPDLRLSPPYALVNKLRPFADEIFRSIKDSASGNIQHSLPVKLRGLNPKPDWEGNRVGYLMLHGFDDNGALFRGQRDRITNVDAFGLADVPALCGGFVFAGCCWGGLIVDTPAVNVPPKSAVRSRTPADSIALTVLSRGAVAFIGSTGLVKSPVAWDPDHANTGDNYYCKPLHAAFWRRCAEGLAPAQALLEAKLDYFVGIPHPGAPEDVSDVHVAHELKQFREMTCLGLGW